MEGFGPWWGELGQLFLTAYTATMMHKHICVYVFLQVFFHIKYFSLKCTKGRNTQRSRKVNASHGEWHKHLFTPSLRHRLQDRTSPVSKVPLSAPSPTVIHTYSLITTLCASPLPLRMNTPQTLSYMQVTQLHDGFHTLLTVKALQKGYKSKLIITAPLHLSPLRYVYLSVEIKHQVSSVSRLCINNGEPRL